MIFANGSIVLEDCILENGSVAVNGDRIAAVSAERLDGTQVYDLQGRYLIPGFVDIHCHAGGNKWFFEDPSLAARSHLEAGTTSVLASLWRNAGFYSFEKSIEKIVQAAAEPGSNIRGIHMEGPYVDPSLGSDGGQAYPINEDEYQSLIQLADGMIRVWTLDPCLDGARTFARYAQEKNIVLAVCYSKASPETLKTYLPYGLRIGSHIFCGTGAPETKFRGTVEPGSDFFVLGEDAMTAELIADSMGAHVRTFLLDFVYRLKGADQIALVSDCCAGGDTLDSDVNIINGGLYGSRLTLATAFRNMRKATQASLIDLCKMASTTPARVAGLTDCGSIKPGKRADLLVMDSGDQIQAVFLGGRQII